MKTPTFKTKCTVRLQKSPTNEKDYMVAENQLIVNGKLNEVLSQFLLNSIFKQAGWR